MWAGTMIQRYKDADRRQTEKKNNKDPGDGIYRASEDMK